MSLKLFFIGFTLTLCTTAYSDNNCSEEVFQTVGKHVGIKNFSSSTEDDQGIVVQNTCKTWPYHPEITLAAFVYTRDNSRPDVKSVMIAMIDNKTKKITHSFNKIIEEDAVTEFGSLRFDTAKYQLKPNLRAIGVRFYSSARGASCGEAYWNNQLILFVPEKTTLRPILSLYTEQEQSLQGCLGVPSENSIWEDAKLSISLKNTLHNSFTELKITAKIEPSFAENAADSLARSAPHVAALTLFTPRVEAREYGKLIDLEFF